MNYYFTGFLIIAFVILTVLVAPLWAEKLTQY
jgi:hypothetical protein